MLIFVKLLQKGIYYINFTQLTISTSFCMKNKFILLCAFMMLFSISMNAQTLSPFAISSSGGFFTSGSVSLSVTVAEMTMVQTFTQPTNILTQGFQQPEPLTTGVSEIDNNPEQIVVYPNPTSGPVNISFEAFTSGIRHVSIFDMLGKEVFSQSFDASVGNNVITVDLSKCSQGIYLLNINHAGADSKKFSNLYKINLIN